MKHEDLFNEYQNKLDWINRRLEPDCLKFYDETAEAWKHAKYIAFSMYQQLRYYCEDGIPNYWECYGTDKRKTRHIKPYVFENGYSCPCIAILSYRDNKYPVYNDDYGMSDFVVINDNCITVDSFGGGVDWWYELDRIIDKI